MNRPAVFQKLTEQCVGDLQPRECLCYLDDLIIHEKTVEENLIRLGHVLGKLKEVGLKLNHRNANF